SEVDELAQILGPQNGTLRQLQSRINRRRAQIEREEARRAAKEARCDRLCDPFYKGKLPRKLDRPTQRVYSRCIDEIARRRRMDPTMVIIYSNRIPETKECTRKSTSECRAICMN
ncbi:MAG: hypothetical protein VYB65_05895, partial [Myxococcota bacterium]|nr:hypothetical protein [Myxococcota bacterium]